MAWVVVENTPGYLPETDPVEFNTIESARDYAGILAQELQDDGYDLTSDGIGDFYFGEREADDLGRVIEVMEIPDELADML